MQTLTPEVLEKVKESLSTRNRLAYVFDKHIATIDKWIKENNVILTTPTAQTIICEELGLKKSELLTKKVA